MERKENEKFLKIIGKGVGISIASTIVFLTIFSLALVNTNMSENLIQPVVIGVTGISILIGSFIANKKNNKNGIINGCLIGGIYVFLIYIVSSIANDMNFGINLGAFLMIIFGIVGGAIGGILGVNV